MNTEAIIKESGDFIAKSGSWGSSEIMVFFVFLLTGVFVLVVFFLNRQSNKTTDAILRTNEKTSEVVQNNTLALYDLTSKLNGQNKEVLNKLDAMHDDVKDIKHTIDKE